MASKLVATQSPDDIDKILYLKNAQGFYRGFKTGYISQNLTKTECYLVRCTRCRGIIREASSCEGETVCRLCTRNQLNLKSVLKVRNSVANLNIKCPLLRDCGWSGPLLEGEKHLKECDSFLITCPLECGDVIKRCEKVNHHKIDCLLRAVKCEFCDLVITIKDLTEHLVTCPAYPIVCKCRRSVRRDEVEEHIDKDCELTEIECPYAKYSCKIGKIPRKDLLAHKREFYIEHQDMIERENCLVTDKLNMTVRKHELLEGKMKEENDQLVRTNFSLERNMQTKNDQLEQKHDLLEGNYHKMKGKNDQSVHKGNLLDQKHFKLREENYQLTQRLEMIEWLYSKLVQELRIRKRLIGTTFNLDLKSKNKQSSEFGNGQYRFVCNVSFYADGIEIALDRLSTSSYSDNNILCITECVVCLQGTSTEPPHFVNERKCLRIETWDYISITNLDKKAISRYRQPDGTVVMEVNFDYDYITYKGLFT